MSTDTDPPRPPAPGGARLHGTASGDGSVNQAGRDAFQAGRDQIFNARPVRPPHEVAAPPRLMNLPDHHHVFVGRGAEMAALDEAMRDANEVVIAAVHGLGGVGKSALAARLAAAQARAVQGRAVQGRAVQNSVGRNPVWWITADTAAELESGLAALATALQPEMAEALPTKALAEWATVWLSTHDGWLLVLDNVTDPAHIAPLLGRTLTGRVLVTSRLGEGWHRLGAEVLHLDVLPEDRAVELLTRIAGTDRPATGRLATGRPTTGRPATDLDGAVELVGELGCLPLAVGQAAAYLHQHRLTARDYLALLAEQPAVVFDEAARGSNAERTIARIWRLTLDQLATEAPSTGLLLRILAWYAPEAIPRDLLDHLVDVVPELDVPRLRRALGDLAAYNMVILTARTVTIHRLVQAVARTPDPQDPHRHPDDIAAARGHATHLLHEACPDEVEDPAGWPILRSLLPHIEALATHIPEAADTEITSLLLDRTAAFLRNQGAARRAITYFERALAAWERVMGPDHRDTFIARNNLALAYVNVGELGRAVELHEQTQAAFERMLGPDHPDTLGSRNNLALAYKNLGEVDRAVEMHERILADAVRVLGPDHPHTFISRGSLASAYMAVGELDRAVELHERNLADRERVLGPDHPQTLTSRNNLARTYTLAGKVRRAVELLERNLADRERVLGPDHPHTLTTRKNLALAYETAGEVERAIELYERTLADLIRVLGPVHPSTLNARHHLAGAYEARGDVQRAADLHERILADRERVLGLDHPDTRSSRQNLTRIRATPINRSRQGGPDSNGP